MSTAAFTATMPRMRSPPSIWIFAAAERIGRKIVDEMNDELLLPIGRIAELDLVVEHFQIIDAVERAADELVAP